MVTKLLRLVLVAGMVASAAVLGTAVASANPGEPLFCVNTSPPGAYGCFKQTGDVLTITDDAPDGHHARVDVVPPGSGTSPVPGGCNNYGGYGTTRTCPRHDFHNARICLVTSVWEGNRRIEGYKPGYRCIATSP